MNTSFKNPLVISIEGRFAIVKEPYWFYYIKDIKNPVSPVFIEVPTYFKTDFASVPRIFYAIVPPIGKYTKAAVMHDFLYSKQSDSEIILTRKEADKFFLQAMEVMEVSRWQRYLIYFFVRLFGNFRYKKK